MKTILEFPEYIECPKCGSEYKENEVKIVDTIVNWTLEQVTVFFECPRCEEIVKYLGHG